MSKNQSQIIEAAVTRTNESRSRPETHGEGVVAVVKSGAHLLNAGAHRETTIESRLAKLGDRLAQRTDAPFFALMHDAEAATDSIRDASERLAAEAAALRWVLRIAKHSEGSVRARLWLDIDRAVSALENLELRILGVHEDSHAIPIDSAHPPANLQDHH
jgi:hypothetical protein